MSEIILPLFKLQFIHSFLIFALFIFNPMSVWNYMNG